MPVSPDVMEGVKTLREITMSTMITHKEAVELSKKMTDKIELPEGE